MSSYWDPNQPGQAQNTSNVSELINQARNRLDRQLGDHPRPENIDIAQTAALIAIAETLAELVEHIKSEDERLATKNIWS